MTTKKERSKLRFVLEALENKEYSKAERWIKEILERENKKKELLNMMNKIHEVEK